MVTPTASLATSRRGRDGMHRTGGRPPRPAQETSTPVNAPEMNRSSHPADGDSVAPSISYGRVPDSSSAELGLEQPRDVKAGRG